MRGPGNLTLPGLVVLQRNYLDVYHPYDRWEGIQLPDFHRAEIFMPSVCELREGQTSSPNLLTEGDLVSLMDKNGIGEWRGPFGKNPTKHDFSISSGDKS
jgi:DNA topoisomerase III